MKRVIALFLSAILLVSLSVPAFAAEPQQSNRIHAALDTPEFKSAYKDLQVVNEIIEEVPNSNICYIYHDLSDGNSISYMLKNNKVVYKAYVVTKEHKVTEYNYSKDGTCVASTNVYRSPETQYNLASNTSLTYAGQIKYSTPKDHLGTISTFYMDCSYRKEVDPVAQYNVAKQSQNKAAYASFLASLISLPLGFAHPLAGAIMALFGLGASAVGFAIPDYMLHAKKTTMHWKIKDTRAADRTYFTTDCEYIITDEEQLNEKYSDVHYYTYTDFVNKNKSMASHFQQLIYRGLYLEPVQWTIG